jgi:hypothetical protein
VQGENEEDISSHATTLRSHVALEVPAIPRAAGGAGSPAHVRTFSAGRDPSVSDIFAQGVSGLVVPGDDEAAQ